MRVTGTTRRMISTGLTFDKDHELLESGNGDAGS